MKTWNQLFIRHGWLVKEKELNVFDCEMETNENLQFLLESLRKLDVKYSLKLSTLEVKSTPVTEMDWIQVLDFKNRGRGEGLWFRPGLEKPKVKELDTYISGIVRQFNRLGFYTNGSCDGHDKRSASISVTKDREILPLLNILDAVGLTRVQWKEIQQHYHLKLTQNRRELLDVAEKLSVLEIGWEEEGKTFLSQKVFNHRLEKLLSISGVSGEEHSIRTFVQEQLSPLVDYITVDHYGNVLAEKTFKTGQGPTILLNAHLDTYDSFTPDRNIIKSGDIWSSDKGILGADDRAGIAILLSVAEQLLHSSFHGKVKFIFTVEEEIGLVGAMNVDEYFLWGTDAAIVVDRRGSGDIVTSCGGFIPFCDKRYGEFFENTALELGLTNWNCSRGGSSDTTVWASHGIQSVNLSVGYNYEHTEDEILNVTSCFETSQLVLGVFERGRHLKRVIREIQRKELALP